MNKFLSILCFFLLCTTQHLVAQAANLQNTKTDGDWSAKQISLSNTAEAELMIRVGDIDNLNHGWAQNFSPFLGNSTSIHPFPWDIDPKDPIGTDRIYVPSSYVDQGEYYYDYKDGCYPDGYSEQRRKPQAIEIPLRDLKGLKVTAATLQFFIDDFQQSNKCSRFQVTLNNKIRLTQMEEMLRYIDQSGPIGKLISITLNPEQLALLNDPQNKYLRIFIDDPITKAGDGYAIDFVKLLVNPKKALTFGRIQGLVIDEETQKPINNAVVTIDKEKVFTDDNGIFVFEKLSVGYWTTVASAEGYNRNTITVDVYQKETNPNAQPIVYTIPLSKEKGIEFNGSVLKEGDKTTLNNIQFERSKYDLLPKSKAELDKLIELMFKNKELEIELSGHTSNEGLYSENILLSTNRAEACRNYLVEKGIHPDRIKAVGYGPDQPINNNSTEKERVQNRRVEVLITRMY